jgi:hypothetical protein
VSIGSITVQILSAFAWLMETETGKRAVYKIKI